MVEITEHFSPELEAGLLMTFAYLDEGHIPFLLERPAEAVAGNIACSGKARAAGIGGRHRDVLIIHPVAAYPMIGGTLPFG
jgi:hypothetical protein